MARDREDGLFSLGSRTVYCKAMYAQLQMSGTMLLIHPWLIMLIVKGSVCYVNGPGHI